MTLEDLIRYLVELSIEDNEPMTRESINSYFKEIVESNYEDNFISTEVYEQYVTWSAHF
jgi:hypothetical protein